MLAARVACVSAAICLLLVLASPAMAAAPGATTLGVSVTGATTATVSGTVNPFGTSTTYQAVWDLGTSTWCTSGGLSGSPANLTTATALAFTDSSYHPVTVNLSGLTTGTKYCAAISATNGSGTTTAAPISFTPGAPSATTSSIGVTSATAAKVTGAVDPSGVSTSYQAVYDLATSAWCTSHGTSGSPANSTALTALAFTDASFHAVSVNITGLTANTKYCAALRASNTAGTSTGAPVGFTAGAPSASTSSVSTSGSTSANVNGVVNPAGQSTTYRAVYDLATSGWCTSHGATGSPANATTATALAFTDASGHAVTVNITGLTTGTQYCAAVSASNSSGSAVGAPINFTAGAPTATTSGVNATSATAATVSGSVNPSGLSTSYQSVYDLATSTWCTSHGTSGSPANSTALTALGFSDSTSHNVSVNLTGLTANTKYCAAIRATNSAATATGALLTFTAGAPAATTTSFSITGGTSVNLNGAVNPAGQSTSYQAVYDLATSSWCTSHGTSGSPANATTLTALGFSDTSFHNVTVSLTGLTAGTKYCAAIRASNPTATATGAPLTFTPGMPSATTTSVLITGSTTANVNGSVDPSGLSTSYQAVYDFATSTWCTSHGTSGSPANSTALTSLGFSDTSFHNVTVGLTGLTAGIKYCAAIRATNSAATATGSPVSFIPGMPSATTTSASVTGSTTATISGSVKPSGLNTSYHAVYDLATSTWCTSHGTSGSPANATALTALAFTDSSFHTVSVSLTGLTAGTKYCAAISATNTAGTATGAPITFTPGMPAATTTSVLVSGATTATTNGAVEPSGLSTNYQAVYDLATSTWCTSHGTSGSPANATAPTALAFTDSSFHNVSVSLTGLSAGTKYCAAIRATNAAGTATGFPVSFTAGTPSASTSSVSVTGSTTATANGSVNPAGQSTTYQAVYDLATSTWCTSHGTSGSPANSTAPAALAFTDSNFHNVAVNLTGLTAGTKYCAAISASNGSGSATGSPITFTPGAPRATTSNVNSTSATAATLNGSVNPSGLSTNYLAVYDLATSTWCTSHGVNGSPANSTSATALAFTDSSFHAVSVSLTGLTANTKYCAAIRATNAAGTATGSPITFTAGAPIAMTTSITVTGTTTATVNGSVNPAGQSTTYQADYALATSTWCTSFGASGTPTTTTATALGFSDGTSHNVSVNLTGLTAGAKYCAAVSATNPTATATGSPIQFTA